MYSYYYTAPSEVKNLAVDVISNEIIDVLWDPPTQPNGILTHYTVIVLNERTGFNFSTTVPASDYTEITVTGLRKLIQKYFITLTRIITDIN